MKLIVESKGISITYNNNEKNLETVFGLTTDHQIIQFMTFDCLLSVNNEELQQSLILKTKTKLITKGYLYSLYNVRYSYSFGSVCVK
jgi:hypothetical protein